MGGCAGEAAAELRGARLRNGIAAGSAARAFALIRAVATRRVGLTPYDVQLMAAWSMLRGHMVELATGEGKTLAASLTAATAALAGRMVHVVTVNDYLAARDHAQLKPLYGALGLSCGLVVHGQSPAERRAAYACDIVYTSNKELVFDYLRDQMRRRDTPTALHGRVARLDGRRSHEDALVLRGLDFAIVDEADSVLIDEARTPLIISEKEQDGIEDRACAEALYLVAELKEGADYSIDRSERRIDLTASGRRRVEQLSQTLGAHWGSEVVRSELVVKALTARLLFERDVHYLVREGRVQIIDEYTGPGDAGPILERRSASNDRGEGRVRADRSTRVGGADYVSAILHAVSPSLRHERHPGGGRAGTSLRLRFGGRAHPDPSPVPPPDRAGRSIVPTAGSRRNGGAIIAERAVALAASGRPVLIGTRSVAASELASSLLRGHGVSHNLLNAAQDAAEADIVARAGEAGRVTIATNMAGAAHRHPAGRRRVGSAAAWR